MRLLGASEIRSRLESLEHPARRSLGQNFVADPGVVRRIAAAAAVGDDASVLEVGPGLGSLTLALLDRGARVLAVEQDELLAEELGPFLLERGAAPGRVDVEVGDVLRVDVAEMIDRRSTWRTPWTVVANLPYNAAVPIIIGLLERVPMIRRFVVMVQAEVGDRLCAAPGGRTIGVPTIKVGWFGATRRLFEVAPDVFVPRPRVDSVVVEIVRRTEPPADRAVAFALVDRAYGQRRKMLRSTIGSTVDAAGFDRAGVAPTSRPEELEVSDWAALAAVVSVTGS
jgi:16S rRNA (adenine1518-N6/adenine1519-N6)-dimethyltransferase